jgi:hypothetical protein
MKQSKDIEQVAIPQKGLSTLVIPDRAIKKEEIPSVAQELSERLREITDSLTAFVMLKQAEQIIKSAIEQTADLAMIKYSGKEMEVFGATIRSRAITEYEYQDSTLLELEKQLDTVKKRIDERRKFLRSIPKEMADTETGELIVPAKKIRDGLTLTVSFK